MTQSENASYWFEQWGSSHLKWGTALGREDPTRNGARTCLFSLCCCRRFSRVCAKRRAGVTIGLGARIAACRFSGGVTRFYTTMSPEEMTKDPIFSFNQDLPALSNFHTAVQRIHCSGGFEWHVDLPQGGSVAGSGVAWPFTTGGELEMPVNLRVLQLTETSQELITDATSEVLTLLAQQSGEPGSATKPAIEAEPANQDEPGAEVPGAMAEAPDGGGSEGGARNVEAEHTGVASEATASGCSVAPGAKNLPALALLSGLGLLFGFWRRRT